MEGKEISLKTVSPDKLKYIEVTKLPIYAKNSYSNYWFEKINDKINRKENLKVIIGRETFSSALLNAYEFKFDTNAEIIGEPSGGKPNCYGEILKFTFPNSRFIVNYSTRYYKLIEDDTILALYPDINIQESISDYY